ncbi:MAG: hypothetical protein MKZ95_17690, partial [Pirellulales bacterium]|nr:hypothetical protein [Pirellulales bacterium]
CDNGTGRGSYRFLNLGLEGAGSFGGLSGCRCVCTRPGTGFGGLGSSVARVQQSRGLGLE